MGAAERTGEDVSSYPQLIETIRQDPKMAQFIAGSILALVAPEGFEKAYGTLSENRRSDEVQPFKVRQEAATAGIKETEQRFAPEKATGRGDCRSGRTASPSLGRFVPKL